MISTEVKESSGGFIPKMITPGKRTVKVNEVKLRKGFGDKMDIVLSLETKPVEEEGFEGFMIDKNDPSKGTYKGQVGQVKLSRYGYSNQEYKDGKWVDSDKNTKDEPYKVRDERIVRALNSLFMVYGKKLAEIGSEFKTIEELIEAVNKKGKLSDQWIECVIGAREYFNKEGYKQNDMFIVSNKKEGDVMFNAMRLEGNTLVAMVEYNPTEHLIPPKEVPANNVMMSDDKTTEEKIEAITPPVTPQVESDGLPF